MEHGSQQYYKELGTKKEFTYIESINLIIVFIYHNIPIYEKLCVKEMFFFKFLVQSMSP